MVIRLYYECKDNFITESRRHISMEAFNPEGRHISDVLDILAAPIRDKQFEELRQAVECL